MPSFTHWIQNTQVRTAAESLLNGLQMARNEAVRRNANVRFNLTGTSGLVVWNVGCVTVTDDCPATIQSRAGAEGGGNARVGISTAAPASPLPANQYSAAIASGSGLPAGATFNGLGAIPSANIGTDITRIDITNVGLASARRLVIIVGPGGLIRMCDPLLAAATNPQGCS
jgi:type IV fimbrial biogenesis protein FimT